MTEQDTFVRAILDDPKEDTHRLVYADWLDERNTATSSARAEFIRLQVRKSPGTGSDREYQLLKRWGCGWLPKTARLDAGILGCKCRLNTIGFPGTEVSARYVFTRGFLANVLLESELGFDGERVGELMRECLANNPVEQFLFQRLGHRQLVAIEVAPALGDWRVDMRLGHNAEEPFSTLITGTRKQLLNRLPDWMADEFDRIDIDPAEIPF